MGLCGNRLRYSYFLIWLCAVIQAGCGPTPASTKVTGSYANRISVTYPGAAERPYCNLRQNFSDAVTISGQAHYQARSYSNSGLSSSIDINAPIRFAEVVVYDGKGNIVQCTETNDAGQFTFPLAPASEAFSVKVFSRALNNQVKASILNCPEENIPYFIASIFTPDTSKSLGTLIASAESSGPMLGAAFNIFDQILKANEFLRSQIGRCNITGCSDFSVAPKVSAYWDKGFNPNSYFGSSQGISFYIPGYSRLFILGGINSDVYVMDTDHFDNSVILHEYGHFLEDMYSRSDSPGGDHSGNAIIDPRLAWSEGWGDFIQGAIRNEARYRDTEGTPDPTVAEAHSNYIFNVPLETPANYCLLNPTYPGCDVPTENDEGNFREFSVTRLLWDAFDSGALSTDNDTVENAFQEIWASLTLSNGFLDPNAAFRNIGLFHEIQSTKVSGSSDWSSLRQTHKQSGTDQYASYITFGTCGKDFELDPLDDPNDNGSFESSNPLRNNDFLFYKHAGGAFRLTLKATTVDVSGGYTSEREPDLDLYLYNEGAVYNNSDYTSDRIAASDNFWDNNPLTINQTESINRASLAPGNYLINVKIYTGRFAVDANDRTNNCIGSGFRKICENDPAPNFNFVPAGDNIRYELILNGVHLCPTAQP